MIRRLVLLFVLYVFALGYYVNFFTSSDQCVLLENHYKPLLHCLGQNTLFFTNLTCWACSYEWKVGEKHNVFWLSWLIPNNPKETYWGTNSNLIYPGWFIPVGILFFVYILNVMSSKLRRMIRNQ
jgi:hypothetical protein